MPIIALIKRCTQSPKRGASLESLSSGFLLWGVVTLEQVVEELCLRRPDAKVLDLEPITLATNLAEGLKRQTLAFWPQS